MIFEGIFDEGQLNCQPKFLFNYFITNTKRHRAVTFHLEPLTC